jgi:hypothetical protein
LVIARLNRAINEEKTAAARHAHDAGGGSPQEARAFIREETERWTKVIRAAKIKFLQ